MIKSHLFRSWSSSYSGCLSRNRMIEEFIEGKPFTQSAHARIPFPGLEIRFESSNPFVRQMNKLLTSDRIATDKMQVVYVVGMKLFISMFAFLFFFVLSHPTHHRVLTDHWLLLPIWCYGFNNFNKDIILS